MSYYLLDHLANQMKLDYVSELKNLTDTHALITYIRFLPVDRYSLEDWQDTCAYLVGNTENIKSVEDARQKLLDLLES